MLASSPSNTCSNNQTSLSGLLTGSTLEIVSKAPQGNSQELNPGGREGMHKAAVGEVPGEPVPEQTVFKLTLGEAQSKDTHFCYTCIPAAPKNRTTPGPTCTIFVTVPRKTEAEPGPGGNTGGEAGGQPGGQTGGETGGQTGGQTDQQNDSGSYSHSVFSWLILSAAGCVLGPLRHS
ncbi:hypothetical protein CSUI_008274 [Cystoisospora suis]|uniref:SRS domain-containing protein n=1 Tax=Cystoisospora suis TaxID=483139 RepID=A0A2C6KA98_9APIC|nr:hypothetical protein CSUI_008274 [Cystoisospora suis]